VLDSPLQVNASAWDALLHAQAEPNPFLRHAFLAALEHSGCASPRTGWTPRWVTLWQASDSGPEQLVAACPLYLKSHSRGEYVFDFAWANAYAQHGLAYYPKALVALPFTPVPGARLLGLDAASRQALLQAVLEWCQAQELPSLHLLFLSEADAALCQQAGLMLRHTVQFHWQNAGWNSFDEFLAALTQDKRKKIRQERRKVQDAGVVVRWAQGPDISRADWDFFYRCYERTYLEHGNLPYLSADFFAEVAQTMPEHWLLFVAEQNGQAVASSLIGLSQPGAGLAPTLARVAYGRYWGALQRVDCLHFEMCYYQPLQWCIQHGIQRFEGGAQGEHKMARALLPVQASSAHWLAHPAFAHAVQDFLEREGQGVANYLHELEQHTPLRRDNA